MNTSTEELTHLDVPARPFPTETNPPENEISLIDLLIILARRKWFIFKMTIGFGLIALLIAFILPKKYTAVTVVLPPQQNSSMSSALMSQLGALGSLGALAGSSMGIKNPNDMYIAMFKSRTVEDAMIQRFDLMNLYKVKFLSVARKSFEGQATIESGTKDGLLRISVVDKDPKRAAEIANGWVEEYRHLSQNLAISEASQRRLFFEQQLEKAKDNLEKAEENMKLTEQKTGVLQLDSQARALIESVASIRAQIAAKEVELQAMRTYATNENSNVVQAEQELASLQAQLAKLGGKEDANTAGLILPKGQVPEAGLEYVRGMREVKYNETIFEILAKQWEMAKLDEAKEGALIQVVDPAVVPDYKSSPKRGLITILAAFAGFVIAVCIVFFKAGIARLKEDPIERERLNSLEQSMSFRKTT